MLCPYGTFIFSSPVIGLHTSPISGLCHTVNPLSHWLVIGHVKFNLRSPPEDSKQRKKRATGPLLAEAGEAGSIMIPKLDPQYNTQYTLLMGQLTPSYCCVATSRWP